jgi:hypothetical protein
MEGAKAVNCRWNGMQAFSGDSLDYQGPHLVAGLTQTRFPSANLTTRFLFRKKQTEKD